MTSLKTRGSEDPRKKLVVNLGHSCVEKRCRDCYDLLALANMRKNAAGTRAFGSPMLEQNAGACVGGTQLELDANAYRENVLPYVAVEKPDVTILGGEACRHADFLQIVRETAACGPHALDVYTNGELFAAGNGLERENDAFWKVANSAQCEFCVVFSFDRMHIASVPDSRKLLDNAMGHFARQWKDGSRVGFVVSSTRFDVEEEGDVIASVHRLAALHGVAIRTDRIDWDELRWAKTMDVSIEVPEFGWRFEVRNRAAQEGAKVHRRRLAFLLDQSKATFQKTVWEIRKGIIEAVGQLWAESKYGFGIMMDRDERCGEFHKNAIGIQQYYGTRLNLLAKGADCPKNQIFIGFDGEVYQNPIAYALGRGTGCSIYEEPLIEIVNRIYPQRVAPKQPI